jgi:hypothetical protein
MSALTKPTVVRCMLASVVAGGIGFLVAGAQAWSSPSFVSSIFAICSTSTQVEFPEETSYLAENGLAMNKMMSDMVLKPTGDVDRDFVSMMSPHHQGAIDMAQSVLRHGRNEIIRRLAQEIIVTQQQEIAAMRLAIGDRLHPSVPSPTQLPSSAIRRLPQSTDR